MGSGKGDTNSDTQGDAPRCKVRQKKKLHQSFNVESDEESAPKVTTDKTGGNPDGEVKRTSQDSGLSDGATAHPITGSSGAGTAALLGACHAADAGGIGPLPLPTTLPSMATLEALTGDLEKLGGKLFRGLEETNLAVYNKVLQGFKDTSGKCKNFIYEMGSLVVTFFAQAEEVEGIFDAGEANFDSILVSVAKEVKAYVQLKGDEQRKEYKKECLDQIRRDHSQLDGTCFIPMIVGNLTAHQVLAMSQWVVHSHVPLKIMMAPVCTQAGAVKVYMKFVEFLARRVIALQERLGPRSSMVLLESESGGRSASPRRECSHSALPTGKSPPPSRHGSPIRTDSSKKASKDVFSPHSQSSLKLSATMNLSDEDVDDTFSGKEGQDNHQTPLSCPGKCPRDGLDDEAFPSKRTKLDVSDLYGATHDIPSKGDGAVRQSGKIKSQKNKED